MIALVAAVCGGCTATTANFTALRPAQVNVDGIGRLAVMEPAGKRPLVNLAYGTMLDHLHQTQFYQLIDQAEVDRRVPPRTYYRDETPSIRELVDRARRAGADAVLVGRVRHRINNGMDVGMMVIGIGDPTVDVAIDYELIDVYSGRVIAHDTAKQSYAGELSDTRTDVESEKEVLQRLVRDCAEEVAQNISMHEESVTVQLAGSAFGKAARDIRRGNVLARSGDWRGAVQHWEAARSKSPDNAAALYNLGLAHEAEQDFGGARQLYLAALEAKDKPLYEAALQRVDRAAEELRLARAQAQRPRRGPNVPQAQFVAHNQQGFGRGVPPQGRPPTGWNPNGPQPPLNNPSNSPGRVWQPERPPQAQYAGHPPGQAAANGQPFDNRFPPNAAPPDDRQRPWTANAESQNSWQPPSQYR